MIKQLLLIEDGWIGFYARLGTVTGHMPSEGNVTGNVSSEKPYYGYP